MLLQKPTTNRNDVEVLLVEMLLRKVKVCALREGLYVVVDKHPTKPRVAFSWSVRRPIQFRYFTDAVFTPSGVSMRMPCFVTTDKGLRFLALVLHVHPRNNRVHGRTPNTRSARPFRCSLNAVVCWTPLVERFLDEARDWLQKAKKCADFCTQQRQQFLFILTTCLSSG